MTIAVPQARYSSSEEIASSAIHGLGIVLSIAGLAVMVAFAALYGDAWDITSAAVYGSTLIVLYTASTLYHGIPNAGAKRVLRLLDHSAIFLLIAGTYTPFALISLRGPWGYGLFTLIWTLALTGIAMEAMRIKRHGIIVALYLCMGWIGVIAIKPMMENVASNGLWLLLAGGICYTLGVPFYLWRRLPYNHALWHLFVLAGSVLHFFAVLLYVLPDA